MILMDENSGVMMSSTLDYDNEKKITYPYWVKIAVGRLLKSPLQEAIKV